MRGHSDGHFEAASLYGSKSLNISRQRAPRAPGGPHRSVPPGQGQMASVQRDEDRNQARAGLEARTKPTPRIAVRRQPVGAERVDGDQDDGRALPKEPRERPARAWPAGCNEARPVYG